MTGEVESRLASSSWVSPPPLETDGNKVSAQNLYGNAQSSRNPNRLKMETPQASAVEERICTKHVFKTARQILSEPLQEGREHLNISAPNRARRLGAGAREPREGLWPMCFAEQNRASRSCLLLKLDLTRLWWVEVSPAPESLEPRSITRTGQAPVLADGPDREG